MVQRSRKLTRATSQTERGRLLEEAFERARQEQEVRETFPPAALEEVARAIADPHLPERDETALELVTIDPPGSMDLDQAMHIERAGAGYRVRYAIADVPAFVTPGGALDAEVRLRGMTVYCPDERVPLHPTQLSEGAASLLPDEVRPAYVWDMRLTAEGVRDTAELYRAMVRSRRRYTYEEVQEQVDAGGAEETLLLLKEVGELRVRREVERGGASLPMPEQEVEVDEEGRYRLRLRPLLPAEDWNAQISLLTGMVAARIMLDGGIGVLRTMPAPDDGAVARFRREARALGAEWPRGVAYGEFLRSLDTTAPSHLAVVDAATRLFRGAGYTAFDGELPPEGARSQAAIAAPYAHVTAPLRRLVDRFGLAVCAALTSGTEVPTWAREALPLLPDLMDEADDRVRAVERACVSAVEAAVLVDRVGQQLPGVVVDGLRDGVLVQLTDPPVSGAARGTARIGTEVLVEVVSADVVESRFELRIVDERP
ncbi:RNB domain-containing ribonuclease [Ornithinimicrobium avium]|uniref:RNB domain-containing ribonuclease n=1 Tax=Ornithinimicrobium avium TaxID=2283195 RepID=A0A345NJ26_9MICO|nr:RNB domain-containing ribonuclease [Ornithinimicrobium avium]AXH95034.1 RNB domain-containing ribonuclease [Ornithinimicrobium avium]